MSILGNIDQKAINGEVDSDVVNDIDPDFSHDQDIDNVDPGFSHENDLDASDDTDPEFGRIPLPECMVNIITRSRTVNTHQLIRQFPWDIGSAMEHIIQADDMLNEQLDQDYNIYDCIADFKKGESVNDAFPDPFYDFELDEEIYQLQEIIQLYSWAKLFLDSEIAASGAASNFASVLNRQVLKGTNVSCFMHNQLETYHGMLMCRKMFSDKYQLIRTMFGATDGSKLLDYSGISLEGLTNARNELAEKLGELRETLRLLRKINLLKNTMEDA